MNSPSFPEGVLLALAAGAVSSIAYTVLPGTFGLEWTGRALVTGLGLGYVVYLLFRSQEPIGRVVTLTSWLLLTGMSWFLIADTLSYVAVQLGLIWLVRSLYHQPGPLAALLDLALSLFAVTAGIWAFARADSVFMGVWTFFLVQALFVGITPIVRPHPHGDTTAGHRSDSFRSAYRGAEAALRRLSTRQYQDTRRYTS